MLYLSQNMDREPFSRSLYVTPLEGGPARLVMDGRTALGGGSWSRDGDLISLVSPGEADTLAIISL